MSFVLDILDLRCQWVIQAEPFKRETDATRFHKISLGDQNRQRPIDVQVAAKIGGLGKITPAPSKKGENRKESQPELQRAPSLVGEGGQRGGESREKGGTGQKETKRDTVLQTEF